MTRMYVDPPSGYLYGFPKPLERDYEGQLRNAGYPEKDIDFALKWSRYFMYEPREDLREKKV